MYYKKNAEQVYERMTELFSGNGKDKIYAKLIPKDRKRTVYENADDVPYPEVTENDLEQLLNDYIDFTDLEDDGFPFKYPREFDQGLYGAIFGAKVRFNRDGGGISSMSYPFAKDLSEVADYKLDENNVWYQRYKSRVELYTKCLKGKIGISDIICINGLNFMYEMIGATDTYYCLDRIII